MQPIPKPVPKAPVERPSFDSPLKVLEPFVSPSLQTSLDKLKEKEASGTNETGDQGTFQVVCWSSLYFLI